MYRHWDDEGIRTSLTTLKLVSVYVVARRKQELQLQKRKVMPSTLPVGGISFLRFGYSQKRDRKAVYVTFAPVWEDLCYVENDEELYKATSRVPDKKPSLQANREGVDFAQNILSQHGYFFEA